MSRIRRQPHKGACSVRAGVGESSGSESSEPKAEVGESSGSESSEPKAEVEESSGGDEADLGAV